MSVGEDHPHRRPRVLVVTTWLPTPASPVMGSFIARDIQALSGIADLRVVHLVAPHLDDGVRHSLIGDVPVWRIPMSVRNPVDLIRVGGPLRRAMKGADLVHSMAVSTLRPLALALGPSRAHRLLWIHTEHWSAFAGDLTGIRGRAVRTEAQLQRLPDLDVAVSGDLAGRITAMTGRSVEVVPNIVEMPPPVARLRIDSGRPLELIAVGGLIARKCPFLAVATVAELNRRGIHARLTWVGAGSLAPDVMLLASAMGVDVRLTGAVPHDEVARQLATSDLFLLPTRAETFCLAAAEALAVGRPVVVGETGGQASFVRPPAGRLVGGGDERVWADAVEDVLSKSRGLSADEIAAPVRRSFGAMRLAVSYSALYQRLLEGRNPLWEMG